jgi:hypothetical protein
MDFALSCAYVSYEALRAITPTPVYPACTLGANTDGQAPDCRGGAQAPARP